MATNSKDTFTERNPYLVYSDEFEDTKTDIMETFGNMLEDTAITLSSEAVRAFDTVAEMQACTSLIVGMTCHTNGFHASGDGGAAFYKITVTGTANGMDVLTCGDVFANLVITESYVTPEMFGAYGDGVHDDSSVLSYCIDSNDNVELSNRYLISETLEIHSSLAPNQKNKTVVNNGEIIVNNTYVHVYGENVKLTGGIIRGSGNGSLMYLGQTPDNENVSAIKCTVENIYFISENDTPALILYNSYKGNYGCYCNSIKNIYAYNTTCAIDFVGDINANNISDVIQFSNSSNIECMLKFEGVVYNAITYAPKENNISQLFYYRGVNTPTILYKSSCANGSYRNSFANCTSEQTGAQSRFIEIENGVSNGRNIYVGITNNLAGGDFSTATRQLMETNKDTYISSTNTIIGTKPRFEEGASFIDSITIKNKFENTFTKRQTENTDVALLTSNQRTPTGVDPTIHGGYIAVTVTEFYSGVSRLQHTEKILIHVNNQGSMVIAEQISANSRFSISGTNIMYHTGNNGTTLSAYITCSYEVVTYDGNAEYAFTIAS